jgi:hypothetical protein
MTQTTRKPRTKRRPKTVFLSLVFSRQELLKVDRAVDRFMQFGEWIRAKAIDRAQWSKSRRPKPGEKVGSRLEVRHLRISKDQARLFKLAADIHDLTVENWMRDLALECAGK